MDNSATTLKEQWSADIDWVISDRDKTQSDCKTASYKAEHVFEILSKRILANKERDDFKRMSVAISDYLKATNFIEELGILQVIVFSFSFGFYYARLIEKYVVKMKEKDNEIIDGNIKTSNIE